MPPGPSFFQLLSYFTANDSKRFRLALLAQWICLLFFVRFLFFQIEQHVLQRHFCVFAFESNENDGRTLLFMRRAELKVADSKIVVEI